MRFRLSPVVGVVVLAVLVTAVTACGSSTGGRPRVPAAPSATASGRTTASAATTAGPTPVAERCGPPTVDARTFRVSTSDGEQLAVVEAGAGPRGVVLVPELGSANLCGWWDYAAYLSQHGFHVLAFDHRCAGDSTCLTRNKPDGLMLDIAAVIARLKHDGAARVALLGGSQGASESLIAGTGSLPIAGIVSLSPDELDSDLGAEPYAITAIAAGPRVRVPTLIATGAYDPEAPVADTTKLAESVPGSTLVVVPKSLAHGWDLVESIGGKRPPLSATVITFLDRGAVRCVTGAWRP